MQPPRKKLPIGIQNLREIREWYNGYNWTGEAVYNPFDLLLLFNKREFRPYWYETGTPTFLVKLLSERQVFLPELGQLQTDAALLGTFDVGNIPTEALMFQAGYLTIAEQIHAFGKYRYRLRYPNREVRQSLTDSLLRDWTPKPTESLRFQRRVYLFEFKLVGDAADGSALRQIKEKDCAAPFRGAGEPIHLIGIEFSRTRRALLGWEVEDVL